MSVLLGSEIIEAYNDNLIHLHPFNMDHVGPNSYDVTLGKTLKTYVPIVLEKDPTGFFRNIQGSNKMNHLLDLKKPIKTYEFEIPEEGFILEPGMFYLGYTNEEAGSDYYVPMYEGRSSMARASIQSHVSAGFGDIFFKSQWTLEITVYHPVVVYPNIRIGQVYFHSVKANARERLIHLGKHYTGKYIGQTGPQETKSYLDFE